MKEALENRYEYFEKNKYEVDKAIELIQSLPPERCFDQPFIELELIPKLGLNNEILTEQPSELSEYFGTGLHLWQYPNQLSRYLLWISQNARDVRSHLEIGCRWGGTFILVSEWLKKIGCPLNLAVAVDPVNPTPFIKRYIEISSGRVEYRQNLSTDSDFAEYLRKLRPEFVFIDGDHSLRGVLSDHLLVRDFASIIAHHDICSQACKETTMFWNYASSVESAFECVEFTDQYPSVKGNFLGIGVMRRK